MKTNIIKIISLCLLFIIINQQGTVQTLQCYYCMPCNESVTPRSIQCQPDAIGCTYFTGYDVFGDFKVGRRCERNTTMVQNSTMNSCRNAGSYEDYNNVFACICDIDLCNRYSLITTTPLAP